jgi:signal transduction histidine kinase
MKSNISVVLAVAIFLLGFSTISEAQEKATALEVVQQVQKAAKSLSQSGEAGLAQFDKRESPWVWKDTYVFVLDCTKGTIAAHPFRSDLIGKDDTELKGTKGTELFPKLCEATKTPGGVWVEYWWPKPNEKEGSRKVSYALRVSNAPYIVGAGIYDDKAAITALQKLTSPGK